jgi:hypothetical protein
MLIFSMGHGDDGVEFERKAGEIFEGLEVK